MARVRYHFAAETPAGTCIEVACGTGVGTSVLAVTAGLVIGADVELRNLDAARNRRPTTPFLACDATALPVADGAVDKVVCLEALYYFPITTEFFSEAHRVLRPGGELILSVVNPRRPGFVPSPGATAYLDADELREGLTRAGFRVSLFGAFSWSEQSALLTSVRNLANRLHLVPQSLEARARIKRLLGTPMRPLAEQIAEAPVEPVRPLASADEPAIVLLVRAQAS